YPCRILRFRPFHLLDRLKSLRVRYDARERAVMAALGERIRQELGVTVDVQGLARSVYALQLEKYRRYRRVFQKYRPRLVVYADDASMKGALEAARELGIPTVELQHSLVSFLNVLCNYPEDSRARAAAIVPDHVFTYGEYWTNEFRSPVKIVPVGFPYLEERIADSAAAAAERERDSLVRRRS